MLITSNKTPIKEKNFKKKKLSVLNIGLPHHFLLWHSLLVDFVLEHLTAETSWMILALNVIYCKLLSQILSADEQVFIKKCGETI